MTGRFVQIVIMFLTITLFADNALAQSSTDCPTWSTARKSDKGNYLEYLRKSQGKKEPQVNDKTVQEKNVTVKNNTSAEPVSRARTDFYTTKRFNVDGSNNKSKKKEKTLAQSAPIAQQTKNNSGVPLETNKITPVEERVVNEREKDNIQDEKGTGSAGSGRSEKKKPQQSKTSKKLNKLFSKKTNKPARPNYRRCSTRF